MLTITVRSICSGQSCSQAKTASVLVLKRLTEDKFRWPRRQEAVVTLTTEQLHWILNGIDIDAMVRHPVRQYQAAG